VIDWVNTKEADVAFLYRTAGDWEATLAESGAPYQIVPVTVSDESFGTPLVLIRHNAVAEPLPPAPGADLTVAITNETATAVFIAIAVPAPTSTSQTAHRAERFEAVNAASRVIDGPTVITGNLETTRWSHAFGLMSEGLTNTEDGFGYAATWPSYDWPLVGGYTGLPVDHAVYRGAITVPYRIVGPDLGSSHRPLLFDVSPASD